MENPASWGPLEKAVAAALGDFHETIGPADGPEDVTMKASMLSRHLIVAGAFKMEDEAMLMDAILTSLEMRLMNPMPMISETKQIADAIRAARQAG